MELECDDRAKRGTSRAERLAMLEFLRIPDNFALMTGQATKGKYDAFSSYKKALRWCGPNNSGRVDEPSDCDESFVSDYKSNGNTDAVDDTEPGMDNDPDDPDNEEPPRHFPATEKRLTPQKDFLSIYMDLVEATERALQGERQTDLSRIYNVPYRTFKLYIKKMRDTGSIVNCNVRYDEN
ncbi:hypothetical protein H257_03347 [Aphanomyces astaci]|uniref:Uncharacterized protein n=1 Tax=Aphanomyces astaci TaxID=112090 RepID=W4GYH7_APHAT|nr:hypothetical protein H257_03347 [Aphanomyces astaci]ETV83983.1 hypothetical protein H257_03347 [Aphanomyces astaci]|eukprot:XP_009825675.1 hypothetical protein H257_03347 [Aphanomyces astaci]